MSRTGDASASGDSVTLASAEQPAEEPAVATPDHRVRLQRQARALGNPTRFALFEHVARVQSPVQVATLVDRFGLNHNVIRQHLAKLCEADLFVEEFAPRNGPGRPALQYRLAPDAAATWRVSSPYEHLALLLLEMAAETLSPREVGRRAGRRAAATGEMQRATPVDWLVDEMQSKGLEPQAVETATGVELVLRSCPFPGAGEAHRHIVCEIHRGWVEGFLEELGSDVRVGGMETESSDGARCIIRLERSADG